MADVGAAIGVAAALIAALGLLSGGLGKRLSDRAAARVTRRWQDAMRLLEEGRAEEAVAALEKLVAERERDLGRDAPEMAAWLHQLVIAYSVLGRDEAVEPLAERALRSWRRDPARAEGVNEADLLRALARSALHRGQAEESRRRLLEASAYYERSGERDPIAEALIDEGLGMVAEHLGDRAEAERLYRGALARLEAIGDTTRPASPYRVAPARALDDDATSFRARLWSRIGQAASERGDPAEAERAFARAVSTLEDADREGSPQLTDVTLRLAGALLAGERGPAAEEAARRALDLARRHQDAESAALALEVIADALAMRGDPAAGAAYEEALAARGAAEDSSLIRLLAKGGTYLDLTGRIEDGERWLRRAAALAEALPDAPERPSGPNALAYALCMHDRLDEAEPLAEKALAWVGAREGQGQESGDMALCLDTLGEIRRRQGELAEARRLFERALPGAIEALGAKSVATALVRENLARLLRDEGRLEEALREHALALAHVEAVLGKEHPETRRMARSWEAG